MKKLFVFSLLITSVIVLGQNNENRNYSIDLKVGKTFPLQGDYLRNNWNGRLYGGLSVIRNFRPIDFSLGCDFEYLQLSDDKINFLSPYIGIQHVFYKGKLLFTPSFRIGYTWFNYTLGKGIPDTISEEYSQNGISSGLDVKFSYKLNNRVQIGIGNSYTIILKSFGVESNPDNSKIIGLDRPYLSILFNI